MALQADKAGRTHWNLLDTLGLVALIVVALAGYKAFVLFRPPLPSIRTVTPAQIPADGPATVSVTGAHFRPWLTVRIGTWTSPFVVISPSQGEVRVTGLPPGHYDLALVDEAQELLRVRQALTVVGVPPETPAPPPPKRQARVRLTVIAHPGLADLPGVGDEDVRVDEDHAARLVSRTDAQLLTTTTQFDGSTFADTRVQFEVTLSVPVVLTPTGWQYAERPVKVGALFRFETQTYVLEGWVLSLSVDEGK